MNQGDARARNERARRLMMAELDGELNVAELQELNQLVAGDLELEKERKRFLRLKELTDAMAFKPAPEEIWDSYWTSVYTRFERGVGWIFASIGAVILLVYGAWRGVEGLIANAELPWVLKAAILTLLFGLVVLLVSVIREKVFLGSRQRYKDVER